MILKNKTWQHRFDFDGILECEHCGNEQIMKNGYDDANFRLNVIPAIKCAKCDKRTTKETLPKITDPGYQGAK
jgi:hypothetical protein